MSRPFSPVFAAAALALVLVAPPAEARARHRRHAVTRTTPQAPASNGAQPFTYYPENIEGGVPGNLPFNNQIRKHTDPLNANGGR